MKSIPAALLAGLLFTPSLALAGDDAIQKAVQKAMKDHVQNVTQGDGVMPLLYKGHVLELRVLSSDKYPDGFHHGVKNQGKLYTSCADFHDPATGKKYDVDFLVKESKDGFEVVQPIVHSVNGKKNPYDLSH